MPNTEKQLTAMQLLREKLQAKIVECGETPKTQYALGFKEALQMIESDWIHNEFIATERQQFIDAVEYTQGIEAVNSVNCKIVHNTKNGETYFNHTFKNKE